MSDLEHARLILELAQDDLVAMEEMKASRRISPAIFGFQFCYEEFKSFEEDIDRDEVIQQVSDLIATWREAHMKELLTEMEEQARYLTASNSKNHQETVAWQGSLFAAETTR